MIDKKKESELYDMVTKIAADGVGPDGLDMYGCSQKNMRSPSLIWKAFGANDQKYHEDQWRPYTYSVIGVIGKLRGMVVGLPERVRLALIRMNPTKASIKREIVPTALEV